MSDLKLHPYQLVGRDFLRGRGRAALFLDMGLGKTATSLSALEERHLPALVIAPKRVAEEVWEEEAELWRPDLRIAVAMGEPDQRAAVLASSDYDVIVLGRDNTRDIAKVDRKRPFKTLIVDELSGYKTRASVRWKTTRKIAKEVEFVWGLTGTPAPNGYIDLWAQIALLDNGDRLGKNITAYRKRYFYPGHVLPNGTVTRWDPKPEAEDRINELLEDICLAMSAEGRVKIPKVTINKVKLELPARVRKPYNKMERDMVADLRDIFGGEIHTAKGAGAMTAKLSQMTSGFLYVDEADLRNYDFTELHTVKLDVLPELIEAASSPVLMTYWFVEEKTRIMAKLGDMVHTIDEPGVVKKWNRGEIPVLLVHPASAGHGLNLQHGGHHIIWTTPTWDLELWDQLNGRLARQGQKHPVVITVLTMKNTVDERQLDRIDEKTSVQASFLEYMESPV